MLQKFDDGVVAFGRTQGEGAEADRIGLFDHFDELAGIGDVIPGHAFDDGVFGDAVPQGHFDGAGRPCVALDHRVDAGFLGFGQQLVTERILADRACRIAFRAVHHRVVCEIDGCSAGALAAGKHVPQDFTERKNDGLGHEVPFVQYCVVDVHH